MKLKLSNLESIKEFKSIEKINEEVLILSHAPYDIFEHSISSQIFQYIGYSPYLKFNSFGDIDIQLNNLIKEDNKKKVAYIFNWADIFPSYEINGRQRDDKKFLNNLEINKKLKKHISILKQISQNTNINLLILIPDINETFLAIGHVHEAVFINTIYQELLKNLSENSLTFDFKSGGQNLNNYFKYHIYDDFKSVINIAMGIAKNFYNSDYQVKAIFVDLDETLWPLNIGDWEKLPVISSSSNRKFHYFQNLIKNLSANGVYVIAVSKNDEKYVMDKFDKIEMPLSSSDFYSINCSWNAKSIVIGEVINRVNILPEHCLFLDDNPAELLEVKSKIPKLKSIRVCREILDFDLLMSYLKSQLNNSTSKRENEARKINRPSIIQNEQNKDYLKELSLSLKVNFINNLDGRPLELINKTNQFNLNGIRIVNSNLEKQIKAFTVDLKDIYGDFGTIGVIVFSELEDRVIVHNFVLSCRAFSRGVEFEIINALRKFIKHKDIYFEYKKTDRNKVIEELIKFITKEIDNEYLLDENMLEKKLVEYKGVINVS